jgi:hypothetical protein
MQMDLSYYFCQGCNQAQENRSGCDCHFDCPNHACRCDPCDLGFCEDPECEKCQDREIEEAVEETREEVEELKV